MWGNVFFSFCLNMAGCSNHVLACKRWLHDKWTMKTFHSLFKKKKNKFCQFCTHEIAQSQFLFSMFGLVSSVLVLLFRCISESVSDSDSVSVSISFCSAVLSYFSLFGCADMHQLPWYRRWSKYHSMELCLKEPNE